jgi:transcription initiation factor IIE alpha subunit
VAPNGISGKFGINWAQGFKSVQRMLIDAYVEGTYGAHHLRVIRIIRQKGFVEEKELTKFSLLPQRNLRVILSRLMCEGVIET